MLHRNLLMRNGFLVIVFMTSSRAKSFAIGPKSTENKKEVTERETWFTFSRVFNNKYTPKKKSAEFTMSLRRIRNWGGRRCKSRQYSNRTWATIRERHLRCKSLLMFNLWIHISCDEFPIDLMLWHRRVDVIFGEVENGDFSPTLNAIDSPWI